MTTTDALMLIATLNFKPFDKHDYMSFSGVKSEQPMIAYTDENVVIIDGEEIEIINNENEFVSLFRIEEC